jgi:hypothetical protein
MTKDEALKLALSCIKSSVEYKRGNATFIEAAEDVEQALAAPVQKGAIGAEYQKSPWDGKGISMPPPEAPVPTNCRHCGGPNNVLCAGQCKTAAPDLQAELEATNRQVEILSDALAESRRQRQWVGLTEHELESLWYQAETGGAMLLRFAEAIEAKLKEKNT